MTQTILDILTRPDAAPLNSRTSGRDAACQSVRDHLQRLFNSRRGSLVHLPDYGMPDIAALYLALPYSRDQIMACLRQSVSLYEPRLQHPQVRALALEGNQEGTALELCGTLPGHQRVRYLVTLFRSGHITVSTGGDYYHG